MSPEVMQEGVDQLAPEDCQLGIEGVSSLQPSSACLSERDTSTVEFNCSSKCSGEIAHRITLARVQP